MSTVLDGAIRVFRERGYNATSVVDLAQATTLAAGSIYKAFKGKRELFLAAFDRYVEEGDASRRLVLSAAGNGRDRLRKLLELYAASSSGSEGKRGCLVVGSATELATLDAGTARHVRAACARSEQFLVSVIRDGQADGSIAADIDSEVAGRLMLCIIQGMRVIGKTGRSHAGMTDLVKLALKVVD